MVVNLFALFALDAYAGEIYQNAHLAEKIINAVSYFFNPLCVLGLGFSITQIMLATNSKAVSNGLAYAKGIIITFMIFNCLGLIIHYADNLGIANTYNYDEKTIESVMDEAGREHKGNGGTGIQSNITTDTNK